jgi:ABC-type ATPase involved in cell division
MELLTLFQELHAQGSTIVLSTHDASLASRATLVFELEAGRIKNKQTMS